MGSRARRRSALRAAQRRPAARAAAAARRRRAARRSRAGRSRRASSSASQRWEIATEVGRDDGAAPAPATVSGARRSLLAALALAGAAEAAHRLEADPVRRDSGSPRRRRTRRSTTASTRTCCIRARSSSTSPRRRASRPRTTRFAADVPDAELHELPGTCAHFVVDRDGTIYQLVRAERHVPPHRRAQLGGDRDRARRHLRRAGARRRRADARVARAHRRG